MIRLKNYFVRVSAEYMITVLIISVALTGTNSSMQKSYAQTRAGTNEACQQLSIASITASGNDGHIPANALDNKLNTRWSNLDVGSFIQADLGGEQTICSVDIAWYRGNLRVNNFAISVSSDGSSFTNVFTGKSSGTTLSLEKYTLPTSVSAKLVRVTVIGNTENNWASITELSVEGFNNASQPPTPNNPPTADDKMIQTNINTPIGVTLTATDPDPGDTLTFSIARFPLHGALGAGSTPNSIMYFPNDGFTGSDSIAYQATDSNGASSGIATITIKVNAASPPPPPPSNTLPTVNDIHVQTNINTSVQITLTGTDPIPGDVLKFSVVSLPQHGTLTPSTTPFNTLTYTPTTGFSGSDNFTYKATTKNGLAGGVDSNIATVTITVTNATSVANNLDPFGIREIYPTKASGEQWFMNMNDPNRDLRTDPKTTLTKNPDGSWKITSSAVRFQVFTSSGYHPELITTLNQQQMAAKGYMQSPNDWRDVEITGYVKLNKQGGDVRGASGTSLGGHYTWYARGGKHIGQGSPLGCEATSYHADWAYSGKTRLAKEQWHVSYVFTPYKPSTASIVGKWVGFKTIMYNIQQNGKTAVKMEIWVDVNDNGNWLKVNEFVDSGGFGKAGGECGGAPDQIITWGGPIATYRWDNSPDVDVKDLSVREIQPSLATH